MRTVITNVDFEKTLEVLNTRFSLLAETGNFFVIIRTEYDEKGNVIHDFLDVIAAATKIGYHYVNTIVYPVNKHSDYAFPDNVKYVVWLCKNQSKMSFEKDRIREKHIWKDVEWGKREKNYNPKGKDPGNVWIPTEDDGKAHIISHVMMGDNGVISRLLLMSNCEDDYELVEGSVADSNNYNTVCKYDNDVVTPTVSSTVLFKSSENMSDIPDNTIKLVVTSPPYWNLKDYFKRGQIGQESYDIYLQRMKSVWQNCYNKLSEDGSLWININIRVHSGKVIPIPYDFVRICKEIGFYYKGIIIWHKSSGIPTGDKNIVDRHEYVLVFSKSEIYSVNKKMFSEFSDYKNDDMNGSAFWNINRKAGSVGKKYIHPAIYPNELVSRIVVSTTNYGDVVLDPFLGSGTSLISSNQNGRSFIGYEYNEGFKDLMISRFENEIPESKVEFVYDNN